MSISGHTFILALGPKNLPILNYFFIIGRILLDFSSYDGKGTSEIIEGQMLFGGVTKYLDLVREKPSVRIGIEELAFTETGYLTDEYERIFLSHFGRTPEYERIIKPEEFF
jgi:hypothetical protein